MIHKLQKHAEDPKLQASSSLATIAPRKADKNEMQIEIHKETECEYHSRIGFCCLLRIIQIGFTILTIYALCMVIRGLAFTNAVDLFTPQTPTDLDGVPNIDLIDSSSLQEPLLSTLLNLKNFSLYQKPDENLCKVDNLLFLIVVHSKANHFRQRQLIRNTWGGLKEFQDAIDKKKWATRILFVLGQVSSEDNFQPLGIRPNVNDLTREENMRYGDILEGSFNDTYHNLRYKHILGLRYSASHCSNAVFFLKADDDTFIDILGLYRYLVRTFGPLNNYMSNIIAGNVFPSGTKPLREGKWKVTHSQYPWKLYPSYLGGLAYLLTPDVARHIYRAAHTDLVPEIWVDDVWVTGLLASTLQIQPLYMNSRYSYDQDELEDWVKDSPLIQPIPFTFSHLDTKRENWPNLMEELWKRMVLFYDLNSISNSTTTVDNR